MLNVNVKCSVYMSDLKTEPYNIYGNLLSQFSRHVRITSLQARNTLHSCLPLELIQELTIFYSRLFNIFALKLSDLGSKMPDSCCSVGCSNRRGDKPGLCFYRIKTHPRCCQLQTSSGSTFLRRAVKQPYFWSLQ